VIGKSALAKKGHVARFSTLATINDEAFGLLLIENYYERITFFSNSGEKPPRARWTRNGSDAGRNKGWTRDGLRRFNELCRQVQRDREEIGGVFEDDYLEYRKGLKFGAKKKRRQTEEDDDFVLLNELNMVEECERHAAAVAASADDSRTKV